MPQQYDDSVFFQNQSQQPNTTTQKGYDDSIFFNKAPKSTIAEYVNPEQANLPVSQQIANQMKAIAIGGFHGEDRFVTTLLKAGSKAGIAPGLTPEAVQATYDDNSATYNKSSQEHPFATGLGDLLGTTLATAPLFAIPSVAGAGIGSMAALGKLGLNAASMAAQGGLIGGLSTSPGQDPDTLINVPGAKQNAAVGAVLGSTAMPLLSSYFNDAGKLATMQQEAAQKGGYTGKIFATDIPSNSWVDTTKQWIENNLLQKLPGVLGDTSGRNLQGQQVQQAIAKYVTNLSSDTKTVGPIAVGNILNKHAGEIKQQYSQLWDQAINQMPNQAVEKTTSTPILDNIKNLITNNKAIDTGLTTKNLSVLSSASNYNTPAELNQFKKQVWDIYSDLQTKLNKGSDNPVISELADNTRQLYWSTIDDMKQGISKLQGDNAPALQAFNDANQFTKNYKQLFDPKARPQLINAIKDSSDQAGKVSDFMNWINSRTTSANEIQQAQKVLGSTGTQASAGYGLQQLYQKSMQSSNGKMSFNVATFLDGLNDIEHSPQQQLYQPAIDAMSGLRKVATQYAQNTNAEVSNAAPGLLEKYGSAAILSSMGYAAHAAGAVSPVTAGLLLSPMAMSFIAKNSPLKNTLIQISKFAGAEPTSLLNFLSTKVIDGLTRGGMQLGIDQSGNVGINGSPNTNKKGNLKVSLNDESPLVPRTTSKTPASQLPQPLTVPTQSLYNS